MAIERIVKHKDVKHGNSVTTEYLLALTDADVKGFPAWFRQFVDRSPDEILKLLAKQFEPLAPSLKPLVNLLMNQRPRSIAKHPGYRLFALVLEGEHGFHLLQAPTTSERCDFDADFNQLLQNFAGLGFSRELAPEGAFWPQTGFERFPQVVSKNSDTVEPGYWGEPGPWELSLEFYVTPSENSFLFRRDGVIGLWTPSGRRGGSYREVYKNRSDFMKDYVGYVAGLDRKSHFC